MPRTSASEAKKRTSEFDFIETRDIDGNVVRVPYSQTQDRTVPQRDNHGNIPEFVNVSGRVQQVCVQWQPNDTLKVLPFGVLRGYQWKDYSEPSKAWGDFPPFIERVFDGKGKYDPLYLLTEEQVLEVTTKVNNPEFGPRRLRMYMAHAKRQDYDKVGRPQKDENDLLEDRAKVMSALSRKTNTLEAEWKRRWAIMTGKKR